MSYRLDMPLEDAMRSQRALRRLKPDPIPEDLLLHLLDLAIRAPSGTNRQNWDFIVVRERGLVAEFARLNRQLFGLARKIGYLKTDTPTRKRMVESVLYQCDHFEEIPALVVACHRGWIPPFPSSSSLAATARSTPPCKTCCWPPAPPDWARR